MQNYSILLRRGTFVILASLFLGSFLALADEKAQRNQKTAKELLNQLLLERDWSEHQVKVLSSLLMEKNRIAELELPNETVPLLQLGSAFNREINVLTKNLQQQFALVQRHRSRSQKAGAGLVNPDLLTRNSDDELREKLVRQENILRILRSRVDELNSKQKAELDTLESDHAAALRVLATTKASSQRGG